MLSDYWRGVALGVSLLTISSAGYAADRADAVRGKLLYQNHCIKCHTSGVHIRKKRKAKNLGDIHYQVNRWVKNNKLKWSEDDVHDVVEYLNLEYYKYAK